MNSSGPSFLSICVLFALFVCVPYTPLLADDPNPTKPAKSAEPAVADQEQEKAEADDQPESKFVLTKEVEDAIFPLFEAIATAKKSRATVELSSETLNRGVVVDRQKSTYQIASVAPNQFTVYFKQPEQRIRLYCNGKDFVAAVAPDAFFRLKEPLNLFDAVFDIPIPMGPYPEPVYSLTLAGADPALTFLAAMESVEIVGKKKFRGKVESIQFKGVQDDGVVWNLWVTEGKDPKPLRLLVDLTTMLRENAHMQMPAGVTYELRFDFLTWRITGDVDEKLFTYAAPKNATEYESLEDYYRQLNDVTANHELEGKKTPSFTAELLSGETISSKKLAGKIVVLDFWATWCAPCMDSMPVLQQACKDASSKNVVLLSVNVGEPKEKVEQFVKKQGWKGNIVLDEDMALSKAFKADVIPMTMIISKSGICESIHFGFPGAEPMQQRLKDEFEVLAVGGRIASGDQKPEAKPKKK